MNVSGEWSDVVSALRWRAENEPTRVAYRFVGGDGSEESDRISFAELDRAAREVAAVLRARGASGRPVMLVYPPGLDFMVGFWGCLYARAIAVPAAFPTMDGGTSALVRLAAIAADAKPECMLTSVDSEAELARLCSGSPVLEGLPRVACRRAEDPSSQRVLPSTSGPVAGDVAYLQYTSGSTGTSKGVVIRHENVLANVNFIRCASRYGPESVLVTWTPTSHAVGLLYGVFMPVIAGATAVHMASSTFLAQPASWLRAISHYGASHAGGPNFAFERCVLTVKPEIWRGLKLGGWVNAFSSGETVRPDTLRRFAKVAAVSGFRAEAFQACYGISETTMRVAQSRAGRAPPVLTFDLAALGRGKAEAVVASSQNTGATAEFFGYGPLDVSHRKIRIVDPETRCLRRDGEVGEVWIAGPDVAEGYWNRPEESKGVFGAQLTGDPEAYLRTGDLGVAHQGELHLVGRLKELIIIRGVNHFPQDIELTAECAATQAGVERAAAFSIERDGEEQLVLIAELERSAQPDVERTFTTIQEAVNRKHGLQVYDTVFVQSGALPRTASGKLKRGQCRTLYLAGELDVIGRVRRGRPPTSARVSLPRGMPSDLGERLRRALAIQVGLPESMIDTGRPFAEYGLDSLGVVQLLGELSEWLDRSLSSSLFFNYPTVDSLVAHLQGPVGEPERSSSTRADTAHREGAGRLPVAVIGIGCHFPGGPGHAQYWRVLRDGIDAVAEVPATRWDSAAFYDPDPGASGKTNSPALGSIEGVDMFDRELFGMSERSAIDTDPQQRLLLELAWETLEDAGIAPNSLANTRTGVFVGVSQSDYARLTLARLHDSSPFVATGASTALASNRISYSFDLHGPSVSIDTACSSSLVAVHLACRALESGDCNLALAGGVSLVLTPDKTIALSQGTFLSPDGKCKPFDASASGYVRGEGAGLVLLKPLAQAMADGDRIYAVVRGTAVNQDGKTNGQTAPNGLAQQEVIRTALHESGLRASDVDYVEAHGTGTSLGDPIEIEALGEVFTSNGPRLEPVRIGSVKSNIGHLEAAAGIASLIKVALCLHERTLVSTLHLRQPNPRIPFSTLPISVQTKTEPWTSSFPRAAGVSAFGFGGTNAHALLEEAPNAAVAGAASEAMVTSHATEAAAGHLLVVSGATEDALRELAGRFEARVKGCSAQDLGNVCFTAALGRSHLAHRMAVHGASAEAVRVALASYVEGGEPAGLHVGKVLRASAPKIAFLFSGGGTQYVGMGQELYLTHSVFRAALDRCAEILADELPLPLLTVIFEAGADSTVLDQMQYMQPALFAIEYALSELWRSWGVQPALVIGHSLGELVAACVAGVFDLEDGLRLTAARGRLMGAVPVEGEMLAVAASIDRVQAAVLPYATELSIGAINGPESFVLSGDRRRIGQVMAELEGEGIKCTRLQITTASHSPLMEPALDAFEAIAATIRYRAPRLAIISNVSGELVSSPEIVTPRYWRRHMRETVRFAQGVEILRKSGCDVMVEIGPRPTLIGMAREIVGDAPGVWVGSLHKGRSDSESLLEAVGALHVHGVAIDWRAFYGQGRCEKVAIPTYAFQRQRYWLDDTESSSSARPTRKNVHPLLGDRLPFSHAYELDLRDLPSFIGQHDVFGKVVFPGAAFIEIALATAREHWGPGSYTVRDVSLSTALVVAVDRAPRCLHVEVSTESDDLLQLRILSGPKMAMAGVEPVEHVRLDVLRFRPPLASDRENFDTLRARCKEVREPDAHYEVLRELGLRLGPSFRGLQRIWLGTREAFAEIELDPSLLSESEQYLIHPTVLDCGLQLSGAAQGALHQLSVPVGFESISYFARPTARLWCHAVIRDQQGPLTTADVRFFDAEGRLLMELTGYTKRAVNREALLQEPEGWSRWVYQQQWSVLPTSQRVPASSSPSREWLVLASEQAGRTVAQQLRQRGDRCTVVVPGERFSRVDEGVYTVALGGGDDVHHLLQELGSERVFTDILHTWGSEARSDFDAGGWEDALRMVCESALYVTQGLLKYAEDGREQPKVWFVTRGAQPAAQHDVAFAQTPLWGFARVLRREHPELGGAIIDLDPAGNFEVEEVEALVAHLLRGQGTAGDESAQSEVALRGQQHYAPQLVRSKAGGRAAQPSVRPDGAYLVTGGLSGLGLAAARRLVQRGARALVLIGRRATTSEAEQALHSLRAEGVDVLVLQGDVASEADVLRMLEKVRLAMPPLRGVIHCAGVLVDRSLARQSWDTFREVLAPKVAGAWNLHVHTRADPLDFFVLYSSNSALVGLAGQSNYAAANAFLDGLAHHRHAAGLPALSINWGPWSSVGLAARAGMAKERLLVDETNGLEVLDGLLDDASFVQAVVPSTTAPASSPVQGASARPAPSSVLRPSGLRERLANVPSPEQRTVIREFVKESVARVAGRTLGDLPDGQPILELGLDSLMTVELRNRLGTALGGRRFPATFVLNYPTVGAITDFLASELGRGAETDGAIAAASATEGANFKESAQALALATATPAAATASNVVVLAGKGNKTPLTLIHGIGGYAWAYLPLRTFVQDRSIVLVNQVPSRRDLSDYVPLLVETIRTKQPHGPYILGGWSAGGRLALEVTAALEHMGERVLGLVMFDVYRQTRLRRMLFGASRLLMTSDMGRRAIADMHPIERLLAVFGSGHDLKRADDVIDLARLVLPHAQVGRETAQAGLAETAGWFLEQLAANGGRGLMLPDATGAATEALEMLLTVRDNYRMTMGEMQLTRKIKARAQLINVAGNEYSVGWQPHFEARLQQFDAQFASSRTPPRWSTPFSRFAEHIAMFDPANVQLFGQQVTNFIAQIDGPNIASEHHPSVSPLAVSRKSTNPAFDSLYA
ncbi:MAG: type polyketide synthase [Myxococcaceae bacterium]|nr:type polyketide synthase [Myxococcaceae bacterium]